MQKGVEIEDAIGALLELLCLALFLPLFSVSLEYVEELKRRST